MKKFLLIFLLLPVVTCWADAPKQLVYGRLLSITDAGILISCDPAKHSHPTGFFGIADSRERIVFVAGNPAVLRSYGQSGAAWIRPAQQKDDVVALVAFESGEYTYTTVNGAKNTVVNFVRAEALPAYSVVTPFDPSKTSSAPVTLGTAQTPELTLKRGW